VLVSLYNSLGEGRYYDVESQSSFAFDHATGKASAVQSYVIESRHEDLVYAITRSIIPSLSSYSAELMCMLIDDCGVGRVSLRA